MQESSALYNGNYSLLLVSHSVPVSSVTDTSLPSVSFLLLFFAYTHTPADSSQDHHCEHIQTDKCLILATVAAEGWLGSEPASFTIVCNRLTASLRFWCCVRWTEDVTTSSPSLVILFLSWNTTKHYTFSRQWNDSLTCLWPTRRRSLCLTHSGSQSADARWKRSSTLVFTEDNRADVSHDLTTSNYHLPNTCWHSVLLVLHFLQTKLSTCLQGWNF